MPAYCFFDIRAINDPDKAASYRAQVVATVERHGGRYLALGGEVDVVEGEWRPNIPEIIEFPSLEQARGWYESDEYRPLKTLRLEATDCYGVLIDGVDRAGDPGARSSPGRDGQVSDHAAAIYDEFFLPALFAPWAPQVAAAAPVTAGDTVLDVACGTGVLSIEAARRVKPDGSVTGLDCNEGMLAVARRKAPDITWRTGYAERLPFEDASFDAVVSQFGLMFFEDRPAALREMWRVLAPGGRLATAVFAGLEQTPGYAAMTSLLQRLFGDRAADALRAPYVLGEKKTLSGLFERAGITGHDIVTVPGRAVFPSVEAWVHTDVKGWTLADLIDDRQYETLLREARGALRAFEHSDGSVAFDHPAHIVTARK